MSALFSGHSQSTRAHRYLVFLIAIMVVTAGAISAAVTAPPSPLVGLSLGLSSVIFAAALVLAGRVTIALERARRRLLPPPPETNASPRLFGEPLGAAGMTSNVPARAHMRFVRYGDTE